MYQHLPIDIDAYIDDSDNLVSIEINASKYYRRDSSFSFHIDFFADFNTPQKDGKTLLEHCSIKHEKATQYYEQYTKLLINRNVKDILYVISPEHLIESSSWIRPVGVLRKVVLNCLAKEDEKDYKVKHL